MKSNRALGWWIYGSLAVLIVGSLLVYSPVIFAWSEKESLSDVMHMPGVVGVKGNAPIKAFPYFYRPLVRAHAWMCGYSFLLGGTYVQAFIRGPVPEGIEVEPDAY
jgi:hypothetical protein